MTCAHPTLYRISLGSAMGIEAPCPYCKIERLRSVLLVVMSQSEHARIHAKVRRG